MENLRKNRNDTATKILDWISKRNITIIPAPIDFSYFNYPVYSTDQCKMLIQKGFNPKMGLYLASDTRADTISSCTNKWGNMFTKLNNNFWFCIENSKCDKHCPNGCKDKTAKFIYTKGHRTFKNIKLGEGGFGKVFLGNIHGAKIGAKYIDVTKKYKKLLHQGSPLPSITSAQVATYNQGAMMSSLLGEVAFEATLQSGFGHPNILKVRDWWIQCSGLNVVNPHNDNPTINLVIATPKCYKNLKQWLDTEHFHFDQIQRFLLQIGGAIEYLERHSPPLSHRDVKPTNILISTKNDPKALLSDFGLVKTETGLTPVYCPPERFKKDGNVTGLSDVYSLGVTTLVSLFENDDAMGILFGALEKKSAEISKVFSDPTYGPILKLVEQMIRYDPIDRPYLPKVKKELESLPEIPNRLTLSSLNLTMLRTSLPQQQLLQLSFALEELSIVQKTVVQSQMPHASVISGSIHDQKESSLCWAFCFSTVIRAELKRLVMKLADLGHISIKVKNDALKWADQANKEDRLLQELVCLVNPRSPKLTDLQGRNTEQMAKLRTALGRICHSGLLRPAGWKRLPSVRRVTDTLAGIEIQFKPKYYTHPMSNKTGHEPVTAALSEGKPTVAGINGCHAVTLVKENGADYVFKNSYGAKNPWIKIPKQNAPSRR